MMSKPTTMMFEIEVPDWAKWVAQDADGDWFFYETKPFIHGEDLEWGGVWEAGGHDALAVLGFQPSANWRDELYEVVR